MTDTPTDRIWAWPKTGERRRSFIAYVDEPKPLDGATEYVPASELAARDAIIAGLVVVLEVIERGDGMMGDIAAAAVKDAHAALSRAKEDRHEL